MAWTTYGLDQIAQKLVLKAKKTDPNSLNQAHKMRLAVAYGLERFWGESLRLQKNERAKSEYWKSTWDALVDIMKEAGVKIPNEKVNPDQVAQIEGMSKKLWEISLEDQRVALAVLTQLCDSLVWWTQRYKGKSSDG
jgi:hypothetical protein